MQAFQPSVAAAAGATDLSTAASQVNAVCGMRNTLLVAADSVTDAMSSLVKELNTGEYTEACLYRYLLDQRIVHLWFLGPEQISKGVYAVYIVDCPTFNVLEY